VTLLLKDNTVSAYILLQKFLISTGASYVLVSDSQSWERSPALMNLAPHGAFSTANVWLLVPWDSDVGIDLSEWIQRFCEGSRIQPNLTLIVTSGEIDEEWTRRIKREAGRRIAVYRAGDQRIFGDPQAERKLAPLFDPKYAGKFESVDLTRTVHEWADRRNAERTFYASLFQKTPKAHFTIAIVVANVAVFVAMLVRSKSIVAFSIEDLLRWGANYGPYITRGGEWWRLLSAAFVHVNFLHILFNMWCLWNLGALAERAYGNNRFLLIYLLSAVGGSIASVTLHPQIVSVGASGAVFGISGSLVGFLWKNKPNVPPAVFRNLIRNMAQFIGFNVLFGMMIPGIDNAAHIGGLVTGFLAGVLVNLRDAGVDLGPSRS